MPDLLDVCLTAARQGGQILLDWQDRFTPREKASRDLVTEADVAAQDAIHDILHKAFPDHDFLGEEEAADRKAQGLDSIPPRRSEYRWIVDPLDGTMNYVHKLPGFAVSIALQHRDDIILGVVFDPIAQEEFVAVRGQGVRLNGRPLQTSGCSQPANALVAVSFPPHVTRESPEVARFINLLLECQSIRRMGSAALNLAYVAAGRLDAYMATSVSIWDVAAGLLMVQEAGGYNAAIDGSILNLERPEFIAAATQSLQAELVRLVS
jgi:myo-inositol-1(or 4)-monophosphatase